MMSSDRRNAKPETPDGKRDPLDFDELELQDRKKPWGVLQWIGVLTPVVALVLGLFWAFVQIVNDNINMQSMALAKQIEKLDSDMNRADSEVRAGLDKLRDDVHGVDGRLHRVEVGLHSVEERLSDVSEDVKALGSQAQTGHGQAKPTQSYVRPAVWFSDPAFLP